MQMRFLLHLFVDFLLVHIMLSGRQFGTSRRKGLRNTKNLERETMFEEMMSGEFSRTLDWVEQCGLLRGSATIARVR